MRRLRMQDQMMNTFMGGLLPEQPDPARFTSVLDVGCGTGGWLIELAQTYPTIPRLFGVDVSSKMLAFAREQAAAAGVADRVQFVVMDALRMLEFPDAFFDLVNQRAGMSWLRTWDWPKLLQEYLRVLRSDGIIRITEGDWANRSNSPALTRLNKLILKAAHQAGYLFRPTGEGITEDLASLLSRHGVADVQVRPYTLECRAGTLEGDLFAQDMLHGSRTLKPFIQKWTRLSDDYEQIYQQLLHEMKSPDFVVSGSSVTAWGTK